MLELGAKRLSIRMREKALSRVSADLTSFDQAINRQVGFASPASERGLYQASPSVSVLS